jgi:6-phosphogluconolactonase
VRKSFWLVVLLPLLLWLAACGGGPSSSGLGTNPPPPPAKEYLFGAGDNTVLAFSVNTQTGALTQTSTIAGNHEGFGIVANPSVTFLYTDDAINGGIDAFSISSSGALSAISGSPFPMPSGWSVLWVDSIAIDPTGKFLYVPDESSNEVVGFTINPTTGAPTPMASSPFPTGASPQQAVVSPSGKFLYVSDTNDLNGGISAFTIDSSSGALTSIAGSPFPTIPGGQPDGLVVDASGKFLYTALTFNNAIAAFTIDSTTGALTAVAGSPFFLTLTGGEFPILYSIALSPSGNFLYAQGSMNSDIYGFTVDPSIGALAPMTGSPFNRNSSPSFMGNLVVDPTGEFLYVGDEAASLFYMSIDQTTGALTSPSNSSIGFSRSVAVAKVP